MKDCIGLIPAAGVASRLGKLPCSKEVLPLAFSKDSTTDGTRVMADCLLDAFACAGISELFIVIREGKWDIPSFFGDGKNRGLNIAYLMMGLPYGTPFSLDQAYPFINQTRVALGFPDIQFERQSTFKDLLAHQTDSGADVVLGLMPQENRKKWDMVAFDNHNVVTRIEIKQPNSQLEYCWFAAVWTPSFTHFMHNYLAQQAAAENYSESAEIYIGSVIQQAMIAGFRVETVAFESGTVFDLGTPDDIRRWGKSESFNR